MGTLNNIRKHPQWLFGIIVLLGTVSGENTSLASDKAHQPTNDQSVQELVLKQDCKTVGGKYVVHSRKSEVLIENQDLRIFAEAPLWNITVLNLSKKIFFKTDLKTWLKFMLGVRAPLGVTAAASEFRLKPGSESIAGQPAELWSTEGVKANDKSWEKCWTLKSETVAPKCAQIVSSCYGTPVLGSRLPVRYVHTGSGNSIMPVPSRQFDVEGARSKQYVWLETTSVAHSKIAGTPFSIPKNFKETKNFSEIAVQGNKYSAIDSKFILEDLSKHPDALFNTR